VLFFLLAAVCAPLSPLFDPDEGYYPATAAESLRSGAFWDLRFNGAPRWEKPILSYALIEMAFQLLGESAIAARVPSAVEGAALILIAGVIVARLATARAGVLSALVVATTLGMSIFSRVAHPEIAVVLSTVTTQLLICVWLTASDRRVRRHVAIAVGVSIAYGLLAKGPVALALPLLMLIGALNVVPVSPDIVRVGLSHAALAGVVATALACPWYVAMGARHGWSFLQEAVWHQNVGRYAAAAYGHHASVFALVLPTLAGLLPWSAALPGAIGRLHWQSGDSREVLRTCTFVSAISALVFYSVSSSKLASYALACVPPLAILIGLLLDEDFDNNTAMTRTAGRTALLLGVGAAMLIAAPFVAGHLLTTRQLLGGLRPPSIDVGTLLASVTIPLGCLSGIAAFGMLLTTSPKDRVAAIAVVGALVPVLILAAARPILTGMYPWEVFGRAIAARPGPVWLVGRRAPSLTFYAGRPVLTAPDLPTLEVEISRERAGWLALTHDDWARLSAPGGFTPGESALVAVRGRMVLVRFSNDAPTPGAR
jgi:4-amino-4-deoxy-L-arabinose transferase-like glycosyltransferase